MGRGETPIHLTFMKGDDMSQILKKKKANLASASLAAVGAGAVLTPQVALANENTAGTTVAIPEAKSPTVYEQAVLRASEKAGTNNNGSDVFKTTSTTTHQTEINQLNGLIQNLASTSNGSVVVNGELTATNESVAEVKSHLSDIESLIAKYHALRAEVDTQRTALAEIQGAAPIETATFVIDESTDFGDIKNQLANAVKALEANKVANDDVINTVAESSSSVEKELRNVVKANNKTISGAAENATHMTDGITGNMDDIHRKAEDSKAADGVKVDVAKTKAVNNIQSNQTHKQVTVNSIAESNQKRDEALAKIAAATKANETGASESAAYKETSLRNIDDVNEWLAYEKQRAADIQKEIEKHSDALPAFEAYKTDYLARLAQMKTKAQEIDDDKIRAKTIERIDTAIAQINASKFDTRVVANVDSLENLDFGNIGRPTSEVDAIQADASAKIQDIIDNQMEKVKVSNAAANAKLESTKSKNDAEMDKFLKELNKAAEKSVSQVEASFVESRPIYKQSAAYRPYIEKALEQTQADVEGIMRTGTTAHGITTRVVPSGTSAATASAAEYALQSKNGFNNGFGSPMLPSTNVNDFVKVRGSVLANSQQYSGGATEVVNTLVNKVLGAHTAGIASNVMASPVIKDLQNQHINVVGNDNVLLVLSTSPSATFDFSDSFAYVDENGNANTTGMSMKLSLSSDRHTNIVDELNKSYPGHVPVYFFYMSVDPATGSLVSGGGVLPTFKGDTPIGVGGAGSGGTGEMKLGRANDSAGTSATLKSLPDGKAFSWPNQAVMDEYDFGIILSTEVAVNSDAGEWGAYAPLYIGDIDDGQFLKITKGNSLDVVVSSEATITDKGNWVMVDTSDLGKNVGAKGTTNIDSQSLVIFGAATDPGQSSEGVGVGHKSGGRGNPYMAVDIALFSPFGIVGSIQPNIQLDSVTATIDTFTMKDPSAIAHTEKAFTQAVPVETQIAGDGAASSILKNTVLNLELPTIVVEKGEKRVSSNTSLVLKKLVDDVKRTSSNTALVVRELSKDVRTASGNSILVRTLEPKSVVTASGNSLVVQVLNRDKRTSSQNSLVVKTDGQAAVIKTPTALADVIKSISAKPLDTSNRVASISVYVDESLEPTAVKALNNWKDALAKKGLTFNYSLTNDASALKSGVTLALFDADNQTTRLDRTIDSQGIDNDDDFEMSNLGGLFVNPAGIRIVDADDNDKFNKDGSVKTADALKGASHIIQLNSEALATELEVNVLAHEIGHVFGLGHDDNDPLMTTYVEDKVFTGEITDLTATRAAAFIVDKMLGVTKA